MRSGPAPDWETPLVVQVSRWDPLKDPLGVMQGFTRHVNGEGPGRPQLVLAGPQVSAVSDDPEGEIVYRQVVEAWRALPDADRSRVHLVSLPMEDVEENAAIVNTIQRHAAVVVQKSLCEGFGLTVAEAMWKGRAVAGSAVGGIQDQIDHGVNGLLLQDPEDLEAFGGILTQLLSDRALANTLGQAARERVRERYLGLQSLERWGDLIERLDRS
ncbi:MAG: glycosyltransferase [Myxococcota bacterium]